MNRITMMVWPAIQKPEILESKVKWAFGSTAVNKASGYDRTPVELFKTLKDDVIKVLHSIYVTKSGRPSSGHRIRKGQSSSQLPRRAVLKNDQTTAFSSHASKAMLKTFHGRLQHYVDQEFPDIQAEFRKGRETRDQIANIH